MNEYSSNNGWHKKICGQPINKDLYYYILSVYDDVCARYPSLTEYSGYNKAASQAKVSASLVKAVVDDRRTYGLPVEQISYPVQQNSYSMQQNSYYTQQTCWHKEFYGRSISKEDYYRILEEVDSWFLKYPSLDLPYVINRVSDHLCLSNGQSASAALIAAVVQDRQNSNGR